jgi:hypothetical protein
VQIAGQINAAVPERDVPHCFRHTILLMTMSIIKF